jgi:hypothetical protein
VNQSRKDASSKQTTEEIPSAVARLVDLRRMDAMPPTVPSWPLLSLWGISRPFGDHPHISTHTCGLAGWGRCKSWRSSAGRPKKRKSRRSRRYVALGSGLLVYVLVKRQPRTSTAKDTHAGSVSVRTYMNLETPAGTGYIQHEMCSKSYELNPYPSLAFVVLPPVVCFAQRKHSAARSQVAGMGESFECLWDLRRRFTFSVLCVLLPKSPSKSG